MKLHKLTMLNFMPYYGEIALDFPTDEQQNVMIVFGDNMRGKTSLLNALRWGFYGKAIGRHSRTIGLQDIVNKDAAGAGNWKVQVFIQFEANGYKYDLRRTADRRANVAIPMRPEDFTTSVHLTKDGAAVSGDQVRPEIDQIAPEQISRFFLFDGELLQEYESLLIEGSEEGRQIKEAIEDVLGVPALIKGRAELGSILKQATKSQTQELQQVQGLEKQAANQRDLTSRQDALERDRDTLQQKLDTTRKTRTQLEDDLDASASVLAQKAKLDGLRTTRTGLETTIKQRDLDRRSLLGEAWQDLLDARLSANRSALEEQQRQLTQEVRKQATLEQKSRQLQDLVDRGVCPTCGQTVDADHNHSFGATLGALQIEMAKAVDTTNQLQSIAAQLAALSKVRGVGAGVRIREIDRDLKRAFVDLQKTENDIASIEDEISGQDTAELARKRILKDEAIKEEGRLQGDIERVKKDIDKVRHELTVAQKAIEGLGAARSRRSTTKVAVTQGLERIFAASIEKLRDRLRGRVQTLANDAFRRMTTQKNYRGLEINSNYGLSIIDDVGRKVTVRSAGAEQVVALSLIDGLNRTGRSVGPVIMDTPFGRLDLKHRDNILSYLPEVTSQFVLLVHSGEIRPDTDLSSVKPRIGFAYQIVEVSPTRSKIERVSL
ncbi:chromosome segregation protein [Devosia equisanguinis]|uniref:Chromosome segregation protein n=1 Tax=Devosia equisanguinis TaxID=2490941 RepID=A0A447I8L1_9HYPH|nr:AAA family ATPase [Devosia equisanguinis]VDS03880.1 chromosome segregation protein [Devosia equisanguinis]